VAYLLDGRSERNTRSSDHNGLQRNVRDYTISDIFQVKKIPKKKKILGCSFGAVNTLLLCSLVLLSKIVADLRGWI
jgi:hypothetical protein